MKIILIFLLTLGMHLTIAEDSLVIVAVGAAETEKDLIGFFLDSSETDRVADILTIKKIIEIVKSDFDFYRNAFALEKKLLSKTSSFKGRYLFDFKPSVKKKKLFLKVSLLDKKKKIFIFEETRKVNISLLRSFSHQVSHDFYRSITGKKSIFKSKILFVSDRTSRKLSTQKELYLMDFDGARKQRLTFLKSMILSPSLSPNNNLVLFSMIEEQRERSSSGTGFRKTKNINLHLLNLKTKKKKRLSSVPGINSGAVFDRSAENVYLTLSHLKNAQIYKMNLKTSKKVRITRHFSDDVDPHVNADGSLLTFLSSRPGKAMIYTMELEGEGKGRIKRISYVGKFNASPRFSPNAKEIVFSSWVDDRFDIYRIGSDGLNLVRLTKNFGSNEEPWYSPDGEFIVFTSQRVITRKRAVQDVYIMNREGEVIRKITENYGKIYTPRWSN